jgi:hypothetical protein
VNGERRNLEVLQQVRFRRGLAMDLGVVIINERQVLALLAVNLGGFEGSRSASLSSASFHLRYSDLGVRIFQRLNPGRRACAHSKGSE